MADSNPLYKRRSKRARTLADLRRRQRKAARRSSQSISTLELAMKLNLDRLASAPSKES